MPTFKSFASQLFTKLHSTSEDDCGQGRRTTPAAFFSAKNSSSETGVPRGLPKFQCVSRPVDCLDAVATVVIIIENRFKVSVLNILKRKELKTKDQMTRGSRRKTSPDSALQFSVTTFEEQGILESFSKLPQTERGIIRQLLEKFGPQQVGVIRLPVPFGPKKVKERRNFLLPVCKLIRYHRLAFTSIAG